ncbi:hypothetical protein niasHS_013769 [Heterodera schachtii]|uniref:Uncharacterized protein n=1 Tax=Heterodera schachtii TaxID=97005 RepID=A0ABD2ISK9_HETSC
MFFLLDCRHRNLDANTRDKPTEAVTGTVFKAIQARSHTKSQSNNSTAFLALCSEAARAPPFFCLSSVVRQGMRSRSGTAGQSDVIVPKQAFVEGRQMQ